MSEKKNFQLKRSKKEKASIEKIRKQEKVKKVRNLRWEAIRNCTMRQYEIVKPEELSIIYETVKAEYLEKRKKEDEILEQQTENIESDEEEVEFETESSFDPLSPSYEAISPPNSDDEDSDDSPPKKKNQETKQESLDFFDNYEDFQPVEEWNCY